MSFSAAFPADASPDAGQYEHPATDPQPPVGTLPTGEHAEAEAAALQAAHGGASPVAYARQDAPADEPPRTGGLVVFGSILTPDQVGVFPPPAPAAPEQPSLPGYSDTSTGRVLADIDAALGGGLRAANVRMRRERDAALAGAARERSLRRDAQARLADAERRIAELDLTVRALGSVVAHAAGHDAEGGE